MKKIFISSVQKEFERERAAIKRMVESDPIIKPHFEAFVFEIDAPAADKTTREVYLSELKKSDVYLVLVGDKYGYCADGEVSPTEQEYDKANELGIPKLVMVRGTDNSKRDPREAAFLNKISDGRVRVRYQDETVSDVCADLLDEVRNSIRDLMVDDGIISEVPFEDQPPREASMDDIDHSRIAWFVERAVRMRNAPYASDASDEEVLRSLHLLNRKTGLPTKGGILLFGKDPQYLFPSSCVKCVSFFGNEKLKPTEDLAMYDGDLFRLSDQAVAFVNRHTFHGAGVHNHGSMADDVDEIPNSVITEAINNAIAHRNYASNGSIQVEVYQNRIEVISPGYLQRPLTAAALYEGHESLPPNPHIARALFWAKYVETVGTGITELLNTCKSAGLKQPLMEEVSGRFRIVIWRKDQTSKNYLPSAANKGQIRANNNELDESIVMLMKENAQISIADLSEMTGMSVKQVRGRIGALRQNGVILREGARKNGHWRVTGNL